MSISPDLFKDRLSRLVKAWQDNESGDWGNIKALIITTGKRDLDVLRYLKSVAIHQWLFGIEVSDITIVFTQTSLKILTGEGKKAQVLSTLTAAAQSVGVAMDLIKVPKGASGAEQCREAISFARAASPDDAIAGLPKLKQAGPLHDAFQAELQAAGLAVADASLAVGILLAMHDTPAAAQNAKKSAFLTASVMNHAQKLVEEHVDTNKPVKHAKMSDKIQEIIRNPQKRGIKLKPEACEYAYLPVVQSGGAFSLKVGVESDDAKLHDGVVLLHLGAKYNGECTNICRTLFFNPDAKMEAIYSAVLAAQKRAIEALRPGSKLADAHAAAVAALVERGHGDLVDKMPKSLGFAMGLELRDAKMQITAASEVVVRPGMVFNVAIGLADLDNAAAEKPKDKVYSIQVADTVLVPADAAATPEIMTRFSASDWPAVSYDVKDEDDDDGELDDDDDLAELGISPRSRENSQDQNLGRGRRNANRQNEAAEHAALLAERKKKQDALSLKKNEETYKRLTSQANDGGGEDSHMRNVTQTECYTSATKIPPQRHLLVSVDQNSEALLVPLMGIYVPLHITTVKSITYSQDGEANDKVHSYVRIQFNCSGAYDARQAHPKAAFIKELSFRSAKPEAAQKFVQEAQALRRQVMTKDKEAAERATLVKQEKLQRYTNRQPYRLPDVWMQPAISARRKTPGTLEAHANGFRYQMPNNGEHLDITYSNIRHAFFQEAEKEMITIIHFNLKNSIMAGKKKTTDIQFFTEVMSDASATLDARRSVYDPDELEEEQRDRERRKKINMEFKRFTKRIQEAWDRDFPRLKLEWDFPYRDLAFQGITGKSTVVLMPTVHCLVQLVEAPYTVVPLADIELVNLERVGFNGKTFDLVVVFKDFSREVQLIGSIPAQSLDDIKNWLTTQDIKFFECKLNLQWKQILKAIIGDPEQFLEQGGWAGFLDADQSDGDEDDDEASEEFRPSSDDDDEEEEQASDDEESVVDSEDESGDFSADSDEESGKDWDELEDEARRADKIRDETGVDEESGKPGAGASGARGAPVKRKPGAAPPRGQPPKRRR